MTPRDRTTDGPKPPFVRAPRLRPHNQLKDLELLALYAINGDPKERVYAVPLPNHPEWLLIGEKRLFLVHPGNRVEELSTGKTLPLDEFVPEDQFMPMCTRAGCRAVDDWGHQKAAHHTP